MQENLSTKPNKTFFWKIFTLALTVIIVGLVIVALIGAVFTLIFATVIKPTFLIAISISVIINLLAYYISLSYGIGYIILKSLINKAEINKIAKWLTIILGLCLILAIFDKSLYIISLSIITIINYPITKKILLKKMSYPRIN